MPGEVDPAVAAYMETRREEILSVIPQLEKALEKARREGDREKIIDLTDLLEGDEETMSLREFPDHQAKVISEVLWLADRVMAHAEFRALFERLGLHGDVTEEVRLAFEDYARELLQGQRGWNEDDWDFAGPGNAWAAAALVRRVLAGIHEDLRTPAGIEFIDYNATYDVYYYRSKMHKPINYFPPHVDEAVFVAQGLARNPEMVRKMELYLEKPPVGRDEEESDIIRHIYLHYLVKYGWASKIYSGMDVVPFVLLRLHVEKGVEVVDALDMDDVKFHISNNIYEYLVNKVRFQYARTWGASHVVNGTVL